MNVSLYIRVVDVVLAPVETVSGTVTRTIVKMKVNVRVVKPSRIMLNNVKERA